MARTAEANQRLREEQQRKILASARRVFARKGESATMADIAIEAGISQGLTYRYFTNKEALYLGLVEEAVQTDYIGLRSYLEGPGTADERIVFTSWALATRALSILICIVI